MFGVIGLLDAFLPASSDRREVWTFGGATVRWSGVVLFAVGGALRLWPVFVLGDRFSGLVAIQPEHRLVTGGVYCLIRHPSYLGLLLNSFGWGLAFRSGVGVVLAALLVPPLLARSTPRKSCCGYSLGRSTRRTVPERGGWFLGFIRMRGRLLLVLKDVDGEIESLRKRGLVELCSAAATMRLCRPRGRLRRRRREARQGRLRSVASVMMSRRRPPRERVGAGTKGRQGI